MSISPLSVPGIALEPDDPSEVGPQNCHYRVCIPIKSSAKGTDGVMVETLPAVEAACTVHKGSYSGLSEKWREIPRGAPLLPAPALSDMIVTFLC